MLEPPQSKYLKEELSKGLSPAYLYSFTTIPLLEGLVPRTKPFLRTPVTKRK